ncbi:MAG TPA: fibro-slime domain-containing protein [Polyangiales bacterium]|nr:fibro-slime domain-containing protein [Polyangiales bacterium]
MSSSWKRWLVSSSVVCGLACSDSGAGGSIGDGGDSAKDDGKDSNTSRDGGGLDGARRDSSVRRDGSNNSSGDGGGEEESCGVLMAKIRDFTPQTSKDFETFEGSGTEGIVAERLDAQHLPVFADAKGQVTSKTTFDQWYRDVPGVNQPIAVTIPNQASNPAGEYSYSSSAFFPIDGEGFGDFESSGHNFHFTTQIAATFTYKGGEVFDFMGDDDLWIFVNDRLALDLGGLHSALPGTIDFDAQATKLGIEKGKTYRMDIFHAERHTTASNFKFSTTITCFTVPPILI